jgi:O-acetylhomoserine (thiol)-lyase
VAISGITSGKIVKVQTTSVHGSYGIQNALGAAAVPIFQTVSYAHGTAKELEDIFRGRASGYIYTRIANPTTHALELRLAELEEGIGCIATSSGMAAITTVTVALLKSGDHIVSASGIFSGTISLFKNVMGRFGVESTLVDAADKKKFSRAVTDKTKLIFLETIGNPHMDVPDVPAISAIAREANIPLVVDNTVTTPFLFKAAENGADIIVHSTSKFINGHGTAIGGAIIDTGSYDWRNGRFEDIKKLTKKAGQMAFTAHLRNLIYRDLGCCPSPLNSFLMIQGLESLGLRMTSHCSNAKNLAEFLQGHQKVKWIKYPGLSSSPYFQEVKRLFGGKGGGLLTFSLGDKRKAFKFIDSLRLAKNLANLGDSKTLVIHPSSTIFHEFSSSEKLELGITEDMIRVSTGIEDFEDIKNDFEQAIEKALEV